MFMLAELLTEMNLTGFTPILNRTQEEHKCTTEEAFTINSAAKETSTNKFPEKIRIDSDHLSSRTEAQKMFQHRKTRIIRPRSESQRILTDLPRKKKTVFDLKMAQQT